MNKVLCLAILLVAGSAHATTVEALGISEMARRATRIVRGVVRGVEARPAPNGREVLTFVGLDVLEDIKGTKSSTLQLFTLGGGEQVVSGAGRYMPGEEVVVLLVGEPGAHFPIGMALGKFSVTRVKGEAWAARSLRGLRLLGDQRPPARLRLDDLMAQIRKGRL